MSYRGAFFISNTHSKWICHKNDKQRKELSLYICGCKQKAAAMLEIKLHSVIDSEDINKESRFWGFEGEDLVFSLDTLQRILNEHPDEKELRINIHCDGGSVSEGLAIYDALRTSGKTIYTNIEGGCHSMAVCILLAAPKENRTANRNCRALIHKVQAVVWDVYQNADDLRKLADDIEAEQNAILDIYEERTGTDRATLESIMKEEKQRTAQELLDLGFIGKINPYTTNKKPNTNQQNSITMSKKQPKNLIERFANFLEEVAGAKAVNYDHKDADGNILFTTEKEDDSLVVGDAASPDGTFELPDGRTVTIAEGVITEIADPKTEESEEVTNLKEQIAALQAENAALKEEKESLTNQLNEATELITEAKNQMESKFTPQPRNVAPKATPKSGKTHEEITNEARAKLKMLK